MSEEDLLSTDNNRMHVDLMFPSEYVKAADLRDRDVILTIHRVAMKDLKRNDGSVKRNPVMEFREVQSKPKNEQKKFVVNKTNLKV